MNFINILPINDLRPHTECENCWCEPRIEQHGDSHMVIHNALDEREKYETGERKPH